MAGNIRPGRLLNTLESLLSSTGGIKSYHEVDRLVSLMQKFSKKLVSRVIYIHILKSTSQPLLSAFLAGGGWSLIRSWLSTSSTTSNAALSSELLKLLVLCPQPPRAVRQSVHDNLQVLGQHQQLECFVQQVLFKWFPSVSANSVESRSLSPNNAMTPSR